MCFFLNRLGFSRSHRPREQTYGDEMGDGEREKLEQMQTIMQKLDQQ